MAAVVRVKRHLNQEPAEALLLAASSKRFKADTEEKSVFKFCGTVEKQEENIEAIAKLVEKSQKLAHRGGSNRRSSIGLGTSQSLSTDRFQERRFKLLNQVRKVEETESSIQVFDLVCEEDEALKKGTQDQVECNGVPLTVEKVDVETEDEYVYDVYYAEGGDFDDSYLDQLLSVQPYSIGGNYAESDEYLDDEDSNDENHYRNDYPDSDDEDKLSDDDGGLAAGMSRMNFEDGVSSEDDEDDFVYTRNYGDEKESAAYIAYKKRITREFERYDDDRGSDSEEEEEED